MIRVLRVLEYTYATGEDFAADQARWTTNINVKDRIRMQSSVVSITPAEEEDE